MRSIAMSSCRVAVLIPCRNEEATIGSVVEGFSQALPGAKVYVFDNDSSDASVERATAAGATVRSVLEPGKGNVVRRMFADIDADCYIIVDGDATYDPAIAPRLVERVMEGHDLVNVARMPVADDAFRAGHVFGNRALGWILSWLFGRKIDDVLSGYKACSRRLVKSFPITSAGFEIETEMVVHAWQVHASVDEMTGSYWARPSGSSSKLDTQRDGVKILGAMLSLVRHGRPLAFFSVLGASLAGVGISLGVPILTTFLRTHRVPRQPTAILATGLGILAAQALAAGLELDTVSRAIREERVLAFLAIPGPALLAGGTVTRDSLRASKEVHGDIA